MTTRIGLMGPYGYGNLGDAAIQDAMIQQVRSFCPDADIWGFSLNPADTEVRHGIAAYPLYPGYAPPTPPGTPVASTPFSAWQRLKVTLKRNRVLRPALRAAAAVRDRLVVVARDLKFSVQVFRLLRGMDIFVVSGGGQIDDTWGGAWRHPYTMFRWSFLARAAGARVLVVSVGAGPLRSVLSRLFCRLALRLAHQRSYRDAASRVFVNAALGLGERDAVCPDLAYSVAWSSPPSAPQPEHRPLVAVGPMPLFDPRSWPDRDAAVYRAYLDRLAALTRWLLGRGYRVAMFGSDGHMDALVIQDLVGLLSSTLSRDELGRVQSWDVRTVDALLPLLASARVVIASRYHGVLLAHRVHTPVLALSYHPKVQAVMESVGHQRFCLDAHGFALEEFARLFEMMERDRDVLQRDIVMTVERYRLAIQEQSRVLFADVARMAAAKTPRPVPAAAS